MPARINWTCMSRRGFVGGLALGLMSVRALAQGMGDLSQIVARGKLLIAMPDFASPPFFRAAGEAEGGLDVEMGRQIAAAIQVPAVFVRSGKTFDDAVEQVANGQADLALCKLSRTLRRGRIIRYARPYAEFHHGLIANRVRFARLANGREGADVVRNFRGELGVIAQSAFAEFAATSFPDAHVREFENWPSMVDAVRSAAIDMAYRDDFEIKKLLVDDPSLTVVARSITLTDRTDTLAIGVRSDAPHLASFADLFLDLTRHGAVMKTDQLLARYRADSGI